MAPKWTPHEGVEGSENLNPIIFGLFGPYSSQINHKFNFGTKVLRDDTAYRTINIGATQRRDNLSDSCVLANPSTYSLRYAICSIRAVCKLTDVRNQAFTPKSKDRGKGYVICIIGTYAWPHLIGYVPVYKTDAGLSKNRSRILLLSLATSGADLHNGQMVLISDFAVRV